MGPFSLLIGLFDGMSRVITQLESMLAGLVEELGYKLWALQLRGEGGSKKLWLLIDQPDYSGDIGLRDCELVSREAAALLDVNDPINGHYTLEVSSPGVDRPLLAPEHFRMCIEQDVDVKTFSKIEGRHKHHGRLLEVSDEAIVLQRDDDMSVCIQYAEIRSAKLAPDYAKLLARPAE
jgi:ribosome maturation factor RimP